jgi:large subunit ribosomal protein L5
MGARLSEKYKKDVLPALAKQFRHDNVNAVAMVKTVVVSMGIGDAHEEQAKLESGEKQLALITGQKPVVCLARKSISNFKLRKGMKVGLKVTLRGTRMYEFLDRLITLAIPRVKDFRGLNPSSFDGRGNFNMGLVEQTVFPEIDPATVTVTQGMNISVRTSAKTDEEARELLSMLGMPFRRD